MNKFLARCGVTSRRKADELIAAGRVRVNGEVITGMGFQIDPDSAAVQVDNELVTLPDQYVYYLLYKPQNVVTTVYDPQNRTTVVDLIDTERRIYPVGRLDYDTTGVLLLTDDGTLTQQLTHPSNEVPRTYEVIYESHLPANTVKQLKEGVDIGEDYPVKGELAILWVKEHSGCAHFTLHTGRYHEVKRVFRELGCEVIRLHRVKFAGLSCGDLAPGQYRQLSKSEVQHLKMRG